MKLKGKLFGVSRDYKTNDFLITFSVPKVEGIEKYQDKILDLEFATHRNKRSLDANAYAWALLQRMAEAIGSTKEECYLYCLKSYSRAFEVVTMDEKAIPRFISNWRTAEDLGEVSDGYHQVIVYYGSHTFNTKEMSVLLEGIISECKALGIETLTPAEIERMEAAWGR